jgi:comEA protein
VFRGLTRAEHRIALVFVAALAGGLLAIQFRAAPARGTVQGPHRVHDAGKLLAEPAAPVPAAPAALTSGVPVAPPAPTDAAPPPAMPAGLVDLNTADAALLDSLPGIGPAKAQDIIAHRAASGGFRTVDDLTSVKGIGPKTLEQLRPLITVTRAPPVPASVAVAAVPQPAPPATPAVAVAPVVAADAVVHLNRATRAELETLAGIGPKLAQTILEDRHRNGPFRSVDELARVKGIGPKTVDKNRHRLAL